jgi:hypothetical protein
MNVLVKKKGVFLMSHSHHYCLGGINNITPCQLTQKEISDLKANLHKYYEGPRPTLRIKKSFLFVNLKRILGRWGNR